MAEHITDLILSVVPEDGSSIGNGAMMVRLKELIPGLSEEQYLAARDELIDQGVLGRGRGRGGSIYRADVTDFELTSTTTTENRPAPSMSRKKSTRKADEPAQVLPYRHDQKRVNNPEVGMVHASTDPDGKKTMWAYDPHLDPVLNFDSARAGIEKLIDDALASDDPERMKGALQELKRLQAPYLNWTGKAEKTSFEIDTVSLHVHERVDPATILANAAKRLKGKDAATQWMQPDMFAAPFENLPLRQALDFYHHEKGWSNRLVAGDSLLVMNSLLTKESMGGKVQMIYIDPPYGIKYGSNFQPFTSKRDVKDRSDDDLTQEPEMIKAFRDTWELGIHSYLTYLRDRLMLARELLTETGSVFVQISDENLHHVRELMDEMFGVENFISAIIYKKTSNSSSDRLSAVADYLVWYAKEKNNLKYRSLLFEKVAGETGGTQYNWIEEKDGRRKTVKRLPENLEYGTRVFGHSMMASQRPPQDGDLKNFHFIGRDFTPGSGTFKSDLRGLNRLSKANRFLVIGNSLRFVRYLEDFPAFPLNNLWDDTVTSGFAEKKTYVVQTSPTAIERCLLMTTDPGDLVLDPTCGSGTTAFVAEKWGRRWITCDTSRVAITLAKQRLMTASFDYYMLRYPHEGLRGGFDYETVPHVTLKSITNNPDIDTIYDEDHSDVSAALAQLNAALADAPPKPFKPAQGVRKGKPVDFAKEEALHEWEVPFDWPEDWPEAARLPFDAFRAARQADPPPLNWSILKFWKEDLIWR